MKVLQFIGGIVTLCLCSDVAAFPVAVSTELPIDWEVLAGIEKEVSDPLTSQRAIEFLVGLRVFADSSNPTGSESNKGGVFYLAPYFQASRAREVIGDQIIASDLLELLDALDKLMQAFELPLVEVERQMLRVDVPRDGTAQRASTRSSGQESEPMPSAGAAPRDEFGQHHEVGSGQSRVAFSSHTPEARHSLVGAVLSVLYKLGTPAEKIQALRHADSADDFVSLMAELRTRLWKSSFGIRQATFDSGYTPEEMKYLAAYRKVRPHVSLVPLPVEAIGVRAIATTTRPGVLQDRITDMEMIRGVNLGTGGLCGAATTCHVVIDYTELGARSAILSTIGPTLMPVTFHGNVRMPRVESTLKISCDPVRLSALLPTACEEFDERMLYHQLMAAMASGNSPCTLDRPLAPDIVLVLVANTVASVYWNQQFERVRLCAANGTITSGRFAMLLNSFSPPETDGSARLLLGVDAESYDGSGMEVAAGVVQRFARSRHQVIWLKVPGMRSVDWNATGHPIDFASTLRYTFDGFPLVCWKWDEVSAKQYLSTCTSDLAGETSDDTQSGSSELNESALVIEAYPSTNV